MKKKEILAKLKDFEKRIKEIDDELKSHYLLIVNAQKTLRDHSDKIHDIHGRIGNFEERYAMVNYLITTKFLGKIKHKRLVSKFKEELKKSIKDYTSFEDLKTKILDGTIALWDLETYMFVLGEREREQEVVDFCNKEEDK